MHESKLNMNKNKNNSLNIKLFVMSMTGFDYKQLLLYCFIRSIFPFLSAKLIISLTLLLFVIIIIIVIM